jgi:hypothetical protein
MATPSEMNYTKLPYVMGYLPFCSEYLSLTFQKGATLLFPNALTYKPNEVENFRLYRVLVKRYILFGDTFWLSNSFTKLMFPRFAASEISWFYRA